jgi:ABC-type Co2+ transport system permease subunit
VNISYECIVNLEYFPLAMNETENIKQMTHCPLKTEDRCCTTIRRNFISAGSAAGVASAFGAPVGGLLFAIEEVSSNWNLQLSWQIFFCAMVSAFTTYLFNSAFHGFAYQGSFGAFRPERYILFQASFLVFRYFRSLTIGADPRGPH